MNKKKELTEAQRAFVDEYLVCKNATQAYFRAYPLTEKKSTAAQCACRLLKNPAIKAELKRRGKEIADAVNVRLADYVNFLVKVAYADVGDFVDFGTEKYLDSKGKERTGNFVRLKNSQVTDTTAIEDLKNSTKHGVAIKLSDRLSAWRELDRVLKLSEQGNSDNAPEVKIYLPARQEH